MQGEELVARVEVAQVRQDVGREIARGTACRADRDTVPVDRRPGQRLEERLRTGVGEAPARPLAQLVQAAEEFRDRQPRRGGVFGRRQAVKTEFRPCQQNLVRHDPAQPGEARIPEGPVHQQATHSRGHSGGPRDGLQHGQSLAARATAAPKDLGHGSLVLHRVHRPHSCGDPSMGLAQGRCPEGRIRGVPRARRRVDLPEQRGDTRMPPVEYPCRGRASGRRSPAGRARSGTASGREKRARHGHGPLVLRPLMAGLMVTEELNAFNYESAGR